MLFGSAVNAKFEMALVAIFYAGIMGLDHLYVNIAAESEL